jgi:hypothetical protein
MTGYQWGFDNRLPRLPKAFGNLRGLPQRGRESNQPRWSGRKVFLDNNLQPKRSADLSASKNANLRTHLATFTPLATFRFDLLTLLPSSSLKTLAIG